MWHRGSSSRRQHFSFQVPGAKEFPSQCWYSCGNAWAGDKATNLSKNLTCAGSSPLVSCVWIGPSLQQAWQLWWWELVLSCLLLNLNASITSVLLSRMLYTNSLERLNYMWTFTHGFLRIHMKETKPLLFSHSTLNRWKVSYSSFIHITQLTRNFTWLH